MLLITGFTVTVTWLPTIWTPQAILTITSHTAPMRIMWKVWNQTAPCRWNPTPRLPMFISLDLCQATFKLRQTETMWACHGKPHPPKVQYCNLALEMRPTVLDMKEAPIGLIATPYQHWVNMQEWPLRKLRFISVARVHTPFPYIKATFPIQGNWCINKTITQQQEVGKMSCSPPLSSSTTPKTYG